MNASAASTTNATISSPNAEPALPARYIFNKLHITKPPEIVRAEEQAPCLDDKALVDYVVLTVSDPFADAVITGIGLAVAADTADSIDVAMVGGYVGIKERGIRSVGESCSAFGAVIEYAVFFCAGDLVPFDPNAVLLG